MAILVSFFSWFRTNFPSFPGSETTPFFLSTRSCQSLLLSFPGSIQNSLPFSFLPYVQHKRLVLNQSFRQKSTHPTAPAPPCLTSKISYLTSNLDIIEHLLFANV